MAARRLWALQGLFSTAHDTDPHSEEPCVVSCWRVQRSQAFAYAVSLTCLPRGCLNSQGESIVPPPAPGNPVLTLRSVVLVTRVSTDLLVQVWILWAEVFKACCDIVIACACWSTWAWCCVGASDRHLAPRYQVLQATSEHSARLYQSNICTKKLYEISNACERWVILLLAEAKDPRLRTRSWEASVGLRDQNGTSCIPQWWCHLLGVLGSLLIGGFIKHQPIIITITINAHIITPEGWEAGADPTAAVISSSHHRIEENLTSSPASSSTSSSSSSSSSYTHSASFATVMRRTSLPAISVQRPTSSQSCGGGGSGGGGSTTVDGALLSEAHGLVADMLQDPHLPPAVVSGLQALYLLLAPPPNAAPSPRGHRPTPYFHLSQDAAYASGSDTEENPYTGERPSVHRRSGRRSVAPSLLRRMSTSTWTTTTSATGMPTLEPTPCRKRASSFRAVVGKSADVTPCGSPTHACCLETNRLDPSNSPKNNRSYSTTALYPSGRKCVTRERQTVCSLHPLGDYDVNHLDRVARGLHDARNTSSSTGYSDRLTRLQKLPNQHVCDGLCDDCSRSQNDTVTDGPCSLGDEPTPVLCDCKCPNDTNIIDNANEIQTTQTETRNTDTNSDATNANIVYQRRGLRAATSDYESSDSPSSLETSEEALTAGRVRIAAAAEMAAAVVEEQEEEEKDLEKIQEEVVTTNHLPSPPTQETDGGGTLVMQQDGATYDLDLLQDHPLLNRISEWDYPVFSLLEAAGTLILSQLCYRVFYEVGLFETFRIPTRQFLNYFHALELGYREIPYHNSTHASDVLHAVYYLTSQPIPGFIMVPPEPASLSTRHEDECESPRLIHRQSFTAEETYGIMGANLPALELMALYTAAAMHDYDHPGRTNAFLVTTNAPQAVLYNDRSVLENHHAASAWSLFLSKPEFNFLSHLDRAEFKRFRFLVIEAILATDLKRHFEILAEFNAKSNEADAPGLDWSSETDRLLALEMCIKLADINGPCKALDIHTQWTARIAEEFYEQGDEEESLGLPISPYMDRGNPQLSKLQESFINHLVAPLCNAYGEAGLMPGVWQEPGEDDNPVPDLSIDAYNDEDEDDPPTSESDTATQTSGRTRKIFCLQTQHLQDNHQYWVNKIKEEQRAMEDLESGDSSSDEEITVPAAAPEGVSPCGFSTQPMVLPLNGDEPMEPIEEERTPASISSSRSFSFEKEDSKL